MSLFKRQTRAEEIKEHSNAITAGIIRNDFTAAELLEIYEQVSSNMVAHLEKKKIESLIKSKKANAEYKSASQVLTTLRNSNEQLENKFPL